MAGALSFIVANILEKLTLLENQIGMAEVWKNDGYQRLLTALDKYEDLLLAENEKCSH